MESATAFQQLFYGNRSVVGHHIYGSKPEKGEKRDGKSWTIREALTEQYYLGHLNGKHGIGLVPILEGNRCKFAAIDVDVYNNKKLLASIVSSIYKWKLPIVPCYSKSEGLHLYLFFKDEDKGITGIHATDAVNFCHMFAKLFAIQTYEVFPKQGHLTEQSFGNWINIPYYGGLQKDTPVQSAIGVGNKSLTLDEAIDLIIESRKSKKELEDYINTLPFFDGPPCLQKMTMQGGPGKGNGRNVYLFNASIYYKEKDHTTYDDYLKELNQTMDDPIDDPHEIQQILSSVIKKEYHYECKKEPLCGFCDKETCATKKFGVGHSGGSFMGVQTGTLTILKGRGKSYAWEVLREERKATVRFDSPKEIMDQNNFIAMVLQELDYKASRVKQEKWDRILNTALGQSVEQDVDFSEDNSLEARAVKLIVQRISSSISEDIYDIERGFVYKRSDMNDLLFKADHVWNHLITVNRMRITNAEFQRLLKDLPSTSVVAKDKASRRSIRARRITIPDLETLLGAELQEKQNVDWGDLDGQTEF